MPKIFHPKVLTANDLVNGSSVFLGAEGWSERLADALIATTPAQAEELEGLGATGVDQNQVVGPYLIEVALGGDTPLPLLRREQIRASGQPSIPFLEAAPVGKAA